MKIEEGKYYRTRDGRKVGPVIEGQKPYKDGRHAHWPFRFEIFWYKSDGFSCPGEAQLHNDNDDLISEWQDEIPSPVRTVTRREIVAGCYGNIHIDKRGFITMLATNRAENIREAAHLLNQIAEVLQENG